MKYCFTEGSSAVCVWGIGNKQTVSKANTASLHIWLKKINSEILRIDPKSLERDSRCIDFFLPPLLQTFFKIASFVLDRTKKFKQVWNYMRVSKWQNFHFCVNYPFKVWYNNSLIVPVQHQKHWQNEPRFKMPLFLDSIQLTSENTMNGGSSLSK